MASNRLKSRQIYLLISSSCVAVPFDFSVLPGQTSDALGGFSKVEAKWGRYKSAAGRYRTNAAATKCRNQIGQSQSLQFARKVTRQVNQGLAPV